MSRIRVRPNDRFGRSAWLGSPAAAGLRQREGNRADSHKQKQVKCAPDEMRFYGGINLFFHWCCSFDSIPELRITFWSGQPFYFGAPGNVNTFLSNSSRRLHNQQSLDLNV